MVNEPACDEAVALAKQNPKLGVGLHLTLLSGHAALPPEKIPGLVNPRGEFSNNPVGAVFVIFSIAACADNFATRFMRNLTGSTPPVFRSITLTAICTCICIRLFSGF